MDLARRRLGTKPTRSERSMGAERHRGHPDVPTADVARRAPAGGETRPAARTKADVLRRERHQPDYAILVAVVALTAIGILMVYSSSALRSYIQRDDTLAIVLAGTLGGAALLGLAVIWARS